MELWFDENGVVVVSMCLMHQQSVPGVIDVCCRCCTCISCISDYFIECDAVWAAQHRSKQPGYV